MDLLEWEQHRATKMGRRPTYRMHDKRLHELGLFSLQKRRIKGYLSALCSYHIRGNREDKGSLFSEAHRYKIRCKRCNLGAQLDQKFLSHKRKKLSTARVIKHWNRFPRRLSKPSWTNPWATVLSLRWELARWAPEFASKQHSSMILF